MMQNNPAKAIREKCLWCCLGQPKEVRLCSSVNCLLYPFRSGKSPYHGKPHDPNVQTNPLRLIRSYCKNVCVETNKQVRQCSNTECSLHSYRFGKNPYRKPRTYTEEQMNAQRERMQNARFALVS